jgi:serine/threonine protein kinase
VPLRPSIHPNVCTIHEVAEADGQTCIVMEYVEGVRLESLIVAGGLPPETFFRYRQQIADALMHAHDRGIVHRDLKTTNVIVGLEGRLKVLDFGLAHRLPGYENENVTQSVSLLAQPETVAGTLAYIAPEVFKTGRRMPAATCGPSACSSMRWHPGVSRSGSSRDSSS